MTKISILPLLFLIALASGGSAQIPTNGLIGFYMLDGNANDSSGNTNNGTAVNVSYSTNRFGTAASSASFATSDQNNRPYVDISSFAALNNWPLTFSLWFSLNAYPTAVAPLSGGSIMTLLGKESAGSLNEGALALTTEPGVENKLAYIAFSESGNLVSSFTPSLKTWYNVVFTFDAANIASLYLNGALLVSSTFTNAEASNMPFLIGSSSSAYFNLNHLRPSWDGLIDDVMVYDRPLSSTEVVDLYNAQSVPEPSTYALLIMTAAGVLWFTCKRRSKEARMLIPVVAVLFAAFAVAEKSNAALITMDMVAVGDPGNAPDTTGLGAVAYSYNIGKFEVTIGQYAAFLNSVATTNTSSFIVNLYNTNMSENGSIGPSIGRSGSIGNFVYAVTGTSSHLPVTAVSWFDAARFANWMNNGATNGASTENGAYALNGATNGIFLREPTATWWIPSIDEWYKAAYYKGGNTNAGYWLYPTASDSTPTLEPNPPGASNSANYSAIRPAPERRAEVGSYTLSASPAGTFDQAGNVGEWNDAVFDGKRGVFGGTYLSPAWRLESLQSPYGYLPEEEWANYGFRLASADTTPIPEPGTWATMALLAAAAALRLTRKRRP